MLCGRNMEYRVFFWVDYRKIETVWLSRMRGSEVIYDCVLPRHQSTLYAKEQSVEETTRAGY